MSHRKRRNRSGATVVELALTLPVLFFVLFVSYELARANLLRHAARAAAYEGARVGILPGTDVEKIESSVEFVLGTIGVRGAKIKVTPNRFDARTPNVRVDVEIDATKNFFFAPYFFRNAKFTGDCELSREIL